MLDIIVGKKVIGIKQCSKSIKKGEGYVLYIAKDVDEKLIAPLIELANNSNIKIEFVDTMRELGKKCGIEVNSSAALIL